MQFAKVGLYKFVSDLFWIGMFYHLYNQMHERGMSKDIKYENNSAGEEFFLQKTLREQTAELFSEFKGFDNSFLDIVTPPLESCRKIRKFGGGQRKAFAESVKETTWTVPLAGLEILNNYGSRVSLSHGEKEIASPYDIAQTQYMWVQVCYW